MLVCTVLILGTIPLNYEWDVTMAKLIFTCYQETSHFFIHSYYKETFWDHFEQNLTNLIFKGACSEIVGKLILIIINLNLQIGSLFTPIIIHGEKIYKFVPLLQVIRENNAIYCFIKHWKHARFHARFLISKTVFHRFLLNYSESVHETSLISFLSMTQLMVPKSP